MMRTNQWFLCSLLLLAMPTLADDVVFYRCTDASGALTLQNMPCPKGSHEEKKIMQGVMTVPMTNTPATTTPAATRPTIDRPAAPAPPASVPAASPPSAGTHIADEDRLPPPNLFQCTTYDKDSYVSEDGQPGSRCIPLKTVGLDGNPQGGAGQACEVVQDQCARIPDGALCDAWKKRRDETEVAWRFARSENAQKNQADFERVNRIVNESSCEKTP